MNNAMTDATGSSDRWSDGNFAVHFNVTDTVNSPEIFQNLSVAGGTNYSSTYRQFRLVTDYYSSIHGYTASVVCLLGLPANMAIIVVLTRPKMVHSSTNQLLIWLAVSDLMTMASFLPIAINFYVMRNPDWLFPSTKSWAWISYLIFAINSVVTWHTIAIWLTISLAIFRFLFICYPTRGQELCNRARANLAVFLVFFFCILFCVPNYFLTEVYSVSLTERPSVDALSGDNLTTTMPLALDNTDVVVYTGPKDEYGQNHWGVGYEPSTEKYAENGEYIDDQYYYSVRDAKSFALLSHVNFWIQALLFKLIPCVLLTALTCFLISAMREANRRRCKLKSQGRRDECDRAAEHQRTTAMLLAIVGLFLVTEFPQGLLTLLSIFLTNFHDDYYQPLGDILDIAALLNNSINFVLYCAMSRQFRETFAGVFLSNGDPSTSRFCCCCCCSAVVDASSSSGRCEVCGDFSNKRKSKEKGGRLQTPKEISSAKAKEEMEKML